MIGDGLRFSSHHGEATARFGRAARARGAVVEDFVHPLAGPDREPIRTTCAYIGPADAAVLMVVISGTHGLEALPGAGCQMSLLDSLASDRGDVAWLFVHLLNGWGAAWAHRHDENNVDINRNFVDFAAIPIDEGSDYARMHDALRDRTRRLDGDAARHAIRHFVEGEGVDACVSTLMRGQYRYADGPGFGGASVSWSRTVLEEVSVRYMNGRRHVVVIDLHTGLGSYGKGIIISTAPVGSKELERLGDALDGDFIALSDPGHLPYDVVGDLCCGIRNLSLRSAVTAVALEFGTYSAEQLLLLQLEDQILSAADDRAGLRRRLIDFFYPSDPGWRKAIVRRTWETAHKLLAMALPLRA